MATTVTREFVGGDLDGTIVAVPDDQTTYHVDHFRHAPWWGDRPDDAPPAGAYSLGVYHLGADGAFYWQGEV